MSWQSGTRLEQALSAYLEHRVSTTESDAEFLGRHGELRDLLEPMLATNREPSAEEPRCLGDFELLREIGRGGMGVVWEARQRSLDRRVAVKLLAPGLTTNPDAVRRLRREAAAAARLAHPSLVKMLGLGQEGETHFLAMELVDGLPIDQTARPPHEVAALLAQVADGLDHAHRAGIVHRDVKPANILVQSDGTATLLDFGLARSEDQPGMTRSGGFAGTPQYAAPEQLRGERVDARSDVFALGVTLFELLTASVPFSGVTAAAVLETMQRSAPDARRLCPQVPRELAAIAHKAMEPHAADRYASAAAMAADLRAFLTGGIIAAQPASPATRLFKWACREPWRAAAVLMFVLGAPLLGSLAGHWFATRPLVQAAEATARAERVEQALAEAYVAIAGNELPPAREAVARALVLAPAHAEALAVRSLLAEPIAGTEANPSTAVPSGEVVASIATSVQVLLSAPTSSLSRTADERMDAATARRALPGLSLAARLSPSPRLPLYVLLGSVAGAAGSRAHAKEAAAVLAELWPDVPVAQRARGRAMRAVDGKQAVEILRRCVAARPDDVTLRFELVGTLCALGDKASAATESRIVPTLAPSDPMAHICFAEHMVKAGHMQEAVEPYRRALELQPENASTNYNLGFVLGELGQFEESLTFLRRAVELKPDYAPAWVNIAATLIDLGRLDEARPAVDAAVRADPDLRLAHVNRLDLAQKTADGALQWDELRRFVGRQPNNPDSHREVAEFLLDRQIAAAYGSPTQALSAAMRALALSAFTDGKAAALAADAWRLLGEPAAAEVMTKLVVPVDVAPGRK